LVAVGDRRAAGLRSVECDFGPLVAALAATAVHVINRLFGKFAVRPHAFMELKSGIVATALRTCISLSEFVHVRLLLLVEWTNRSAKLLEQADGVEAVAQQQPEDAVLLIPSMPTRTGPPPRLGWHSRLGTPVATVDSAQNRPFAPLRLDVGVM
jgi:hypothetical protein